MGYTFDRENSIFNNPNRDIIKRLYFKNTSEFYDYCEKIIQSRIDIIVKYNIYYIDRWRKESSLWTYV